VTHDPESPHPRYPDTPYQGYQQDPQHPERPAYPPQPVVPYPPAGYQPVPQQVWVQPGLPVGYGYPVQAPPASGMYVAAAVINWVVLGLVILATCGLGIIAAAWFIPMTIYMHKGARDRQKHTGLGVCTLLFCNIVSGILLLIEDASNR
jgi:hypothetical protein